MQKNHPCLWFDGQAEDAVYRGGLDDRQLRNAKRG
jgi:predicted 3-demethylubiquinone-9 3-methyltransferase (glyoxalase superfamily)